ncbi:MAG: hypothetical protein LiPW39_227 [Parcubacteria group bacterium LiPW_39]|nr:MAG: hypothetical protein LiPW39_227 [Parcubacteria group bacterium LiPW_39]
MIFYDTMVIGNMKLYVEFSERFWKILANVWTFASMAFFVIDFFRPGHYNYLAGPLSAIYISILGLFAGTKEIERWRGCHFSKYLGEYFVVLWTILLLGFFVASILLRDFYRPSSELVTVYISVLGIFILTQKSKRWYKNR